MKIEELIERYNREKQQKQEREERLRELEEQTEAKRAEADKLAEAGDVEGFKKAEAKIEDLEREKYVVLKQLAKKLVTPEDGQECWREYAAGYDISMRKKLAAYDREKEKLAASYAALCKAQNEALQRRETLAILTDTEPGSYELPASLPGAKVAVPVTLNNLAPEAAFFTASGIWTRHDGNYIGYHGADLINNIVRLQKPVTSPQFE